ncbi:unnamed protein product [Ceutorhynchus assimilis]|uniref:X-box-binding protein 1 n=1 Tax=Ceutorhynchus assimilis TaxID=467358 RepID=A0A9N9MI90_9CUCU|nr:unnamed protein product [Ceutorhynchus assimilis]
MSTTGVLPVPTILNILNDSNNNYMDDQNMDNHSRAKKRRLDHLSWEEKIQRKKLKNRVAAQTSRDRKKAKQEQMESAVQQLYTKNEILQAECEKLQAANQRLLAENAELNQRLQQCDSCKKLQSCPGVSSFGEEEGRSVETDSGLPSLPDLLDELESDSVDLNALEQLTQSLLEDIARDLESAAEKAADQESTSCTGENENPPDGKEVVGSPPKHLESKGTKTIEPDNVIEDISEYLLLHHNYAKMPISTAATRKSQKKLKTIRPKEKPTKTISLPEQLENKNNELLFGTFDQSTNTITILVNDNSNNSSPRSDLGYESLDSPVSTSDMDSWDHSVSELFPTLF